MNPQYRIKKLIFGTYEDLDECYVLNSICLKISKEYSVNYKYIDFQEGQSRRDFIPV